MPDKHRHHFITLDADVNVCRRQFTGAFHLVQNAYCSCIKDVHYCHSELQLLPVHYGAVSQSVMEMYGLNERTKMILQKTGK